MMRKMKRVGLLPLSLRPSFNVPNLIPIASFSSSSLLFNPLISFTNSSSSSTASSPLVRGRVCSSISSLYSHRSSSSPSSSALLFIQSKHQHRYQSTTGKTSKSSSDHEESTEGNPNTTTATTVNRPRAVGHTSMGKKHSRTWLFAIVGGTLLCLGYVAVLNDFSIQKLIDNIQTMTSNILERSTGDPLPDDLQRAIPTPPPGYLTLLLSVEDVLVLRTYHRKYGWVYEPRDGIKDLLRSLVDPNVPVFVTLWSENGGAVAAEIMEKLAQDIGGPPAHSQPLSIDHMFLRDGNKRKEKRLEYFNKDLSTVLLIDHTNSVSEELNPANTLLVEPMTKVQERRKQLIEEGEKQGITNIRATLPPDTTMFCIKELVQRIREDAQAAGGIVNVPRTLTRLRQEAKVAGFATDTQGLYQYLLFAAERDSQAEKERHESGLGGYLRILVQTSAVLRGKLSTGEAASVRPFRDPMDELPHDSYLLQKFNNTVARMFVGGGGGPQ